MNGSVWAKKSEIYIGDIGTLMISDLDIGTKK